MLKIPQNVRFVLDTLHKNSHDAYIVGGCVRDALLGGEPYDYDVTTSAKPEEVMALFERTIPTGIKHGTITVLSDGKPIEVTTFRTDGSYSDSRRPDKVQFVANLDGDLARRDFTVNALAFNEKTGLVDLYGGNADLENKILRAVGDPQKRFQEDTLRILRLFRFAATLGFEIEEKTFYAALKEKDRLKSISRERIATELKKAICGKYPEALFSLTDSGALAFLGFDRTPDFEIVKTSALTDNAKLFFTLYTGCVSPTKTANELKLSNLEKEYIQNMLYLCSLKSPQNRADIKNAVFKANMETIEDWLYYLEKTQKIDPSLRKEKDKITENNEPYLIEHLDINGNEIKEMGFAGTKIGEILEILRKAVIENPELNHKEILKNIINKL